MKRIGLVVEVTVVLCLVVATGSIADTTERGRVPLACSPVGEVRDLGMVPFVSGDNPPTTAFVWDGPGGVVVDVVGDEIQSGAFTVSGIPDGATVVWAHMYEASWEWVATNPASAVFDGNSLPAVLPFDHDSGRGYGGTAFFELCAYRWEVTPYVTGNGSYPYSVSWLNQTYGEALVVVYSHPSEPRRQIIVNDGAESLENASSSSEFAGVAADSATLFLFTEADDSSGYAELISFNGMVILGPGDVFHGNRGYAASLFELPVLCVSGTNAVACSTDEDWFGWHLAILETYGWVGLVTGGGWIPGDQPGPGNKGTFGFNVHSEDEAVWGQLQFNDHGTGMRVHSDTIKTLDIYGDTVADFSGDCRVDGVSGYSFGCEVEDRGEPGHGVDRFSIGIYDADGNLYYSAGDFLGGGNIQIHVSQGGGSAKGASKQEEQPDPSPSPPCAMGGGSQVLLSGERLSQNSPNPFTQRTTISFHLPASGHATLEICDMTGRLVATLVDGKLSPGTHSVTWERDGTPSGIYFYKLTAGNVTATRKMVVLR